MKTTQIDNARLYKSRFNGSDQFYLADPNKVTIKKNGGKRWGVKKEFSLSLGPSLEAHLYRKPSTWNPINRWIWGHRN